MIDVDPGFGAALIVGLLGSSHCIGMCGGIVSALNTGIGDGINPRPGKLLFHHLGYNAGRILSYVLVGLVAGSVGAGLAGLGMSPLVGRLFAAAMMVALGLYLANWWRGLVLLERWGAKLWRYIQPLGRHLLPVTHPGQAFLLGMLWGWLPCGLVYTAVAWSLTSNNAWDGALLMLGFGLGTLPALLLVGNAFHYLSRWTRSPAIRAAAGSLLIGLGLYSGYRVLLDNGQHHLPTQVQVQPQALALTSPGSDIIEMPAILHNIG